MFEACAQSKILRLWNEKTRRTQVGFLHCIFFFFWFFLFFLLALSFVLLFIVGLSVAFVNAKKVSTKMSGREFSAKLSTIGKERFFFSIFVSKNLTFNLVYFSPSLNSLYHVYAAQACFKRLFPTYQPIARNIWAVNAMTSQADHVRYPSKRVWISACRSRFAKKIFCPVLVHHQ